VLVIGGGIGGLAAAVALGRVGVPATVFERAPVIQEVGAGLSLWSNAVKALRRLGLEERVLPLGSVVERVRTITQGGRFLNETDIGGLGRRAGASSICVHRADLQRVLAEAIPSGRLHTGRTCVGFAQDSRGVTAAFAEGGPAGGTVLVGADGIRSAVRDQLLGKSEPRRLSGLARAYPFRP
jgi:2-polyprenyl-6-methoxyphenol hydroxylase-like FAD-dependent oxidoreductase